MAAWAEVAAMGDLGTFIYALLDNWASIITGGIFTALFTVLERWRNKPFSWRLFFILFIVGGYFGASYSAWKEEYSKNRDVRQGLLNARAELARYQESHWISLSSQESVELSAALRLMSVPSPDVNVLCALAACGDLAEAFMQVFDKVNWKPKLIAGYPYEAPNGIELWYRTDDERALADKIEMATKGRLNITTHRFDSRGDQLNLMIGRKR